MISECEGVPIEVEGEEGSGDVAADADADADAGDTADVVEAVSCSDMLKKEVGGNYNLKSTTANKVIE